MISCDGDFLLPNLVVLIPRNMLIKDSPDLFQFVKDVVEKLGYEAWN
ncbi:hypothetical protein SLEP1_g52252 [Rubroshorea leprosula]|uniref:Uncharacterized protein n=1 Tax=Rubroshorea leprosula TaxID=152421 RepID=A0AAV5M8C2_9ROSI|nr:hypothetical protein SLEP1_g52252 [Rubroshorea leprosula]